MDIDIHWKPVNNMIILMVVNMDFMMTRRTFMGNGVNLWPSNTISYRLSVSYLRGTYGYYWSIIVISILIIIIVQWLIMLNTAVGWFIYIYIYILDMLMDIDILYHWSGHRIRTEHGELGNLTGLLKNPLISSANHLWFHGFFMGEIW